MRASIEACAAFGRTIRTRTLRTAPAAVGTRCRLSRLEPTKARANRAEPGGGMEIARRPSWPRIPSVDAQNAQSAERARRPLDIHRLCFWTPMRPSSQYHNHACSRLAYSELTNRTRCCLTCQLRAEALHVQRERGAEITLPTACGPLGSMTTFPLGAVGRLVSAPAPRISPCQVCLAQR